MNGHDELMNKYDELVNACAILREVLDCDTNPGLIGSPIEVVLEAEATIKQLKAQLATAEHRGMEKAIDALKTWHMAVCRSSECREGDKIVAIRAAMAEPGKSAVLTSPDGLELNATGKVRV